MKKGFTLIELLAVIVILAIILLIALPVLNGVVEKVKRDSFFNSAKMIVKAAEVSYTTDQNITTSKKVIFTDGVPNSDLIKISGQKPQNGAVVIYPDGSIEIALHNGKYCATKTKKGEVLLSEVPLSECKLPVVFASITSGMNHSLLVSDEGDLYLNYLNSDPSALITYHNHISIDDISSPAEDDKILFTNAMSLLSVIFMFDYANGGNHIQSSIQIDEFFNSNAFKNFIYFDYFHDGYFESSSPEFIYDERLIGGPDESSDEQYQFLVNYPITLYNDSYSDPDDSFKKYVDYVIDYGKDLIQLSASNEDIAKFVFETFYMSFYPNPLPFELENFMFDEFIYYAKHRTNINPYWIIAYVNEPLVDNDSYTELDTFLANPTNQQNMNNDREDVFNILDVMNNSLASNLDLFKGKEEARILANYYLAKLRLQSMELEPAFDAVIYFMFTEPNEDIFSMYEDYELEDAIEGLIVNSTPAFEAFKTEFMNYINDPGIFKFSSTTVPLDISDVKDVKISDLGVFILKNNGDVYSMGEKAGHGGDDTSSFGSVYVDSFTKIPTLSDVKEIFLFSTSYAFFLTNTGDLYSYGLNSEMLGLKPGISTNYVWTPTLVSGVSNVKDVKSVNYFTVITTNDGDAYISGTLGQSRSGGSTAYIIRLNLLPIPASKPIANVYPLAETGSPKTYRSLIVYEDGTTEYVLKNTNYYSHHPIAQAIVKQASSITDVADIVTNEWAYVSIMTTNSGETYAMGSDTSIFKDTVYDAMTSSFTLIDNSSFDKISISPYGDKYIFITSNGTFKYSGPANYPELNLSPVIPHEWDSEINRTNGLALVNGLKIKGVSIYRGNRTISENFVVLDENNNIHNYGHIIIDTSPE